LRYDAKKLYCQLFFAEGVKLEIELILEQMRKHFPVPDGNELPNKPAAL
jgi:hypothetical protein